jgi:uncharacterized membrane protein
MQRCKDERGAVAVTAALVMTVLLGAASLALDLGLQRVGVRDMQALADVVALDMARQIDGRSVDTIQADPKWLQGRDASVARNASTIGDPPTVTPVLGSVSDLTGAFTEMTGTQVPNAVRVSAASSVNYVLRSGAGAVTRTAVATARAGVCFALGSYAARVNAGSSALLGPILGAIDSDLNISLVSYQGLAGLDVRLGDVAADLNAGTVSELAATSVTASNFYIAVAHVLQDDGHAAEATLLQSLALKITNLPTITIGNIIGLTTAGEGALDSELNVLDLITGAAMVANGSNAVSVPSLGITIPGVSNLSGALTVIEALKPVCPTKNATGTGSKATSTQVSLSMGGTLAALPSVLGLTTTSTGLSLSASIAKAEGTLRDVACSDAPSTNDPEGINVDVRTGLTTVNLSVPLKLTGSAAILGLSLANYDVSVTVTASLSPADNIESVEYRVPPLKYGDAKETVNGGAPLPTASLGTPTIKVTNLLGLPVTLSASQQATLLSSISSTVVSNVINPLITNLNNLLLGPVSDTLGLKLGGADLYMFPRPSCTSPALRG